MQVKELMKSPVYTLDADAPARAASEMMRQRHINHVPVLKDGALLGVLSSRDLEAIAHLVSWLGIGKERYDEYLEQTLATVLRTRFTSGHDVLSASPDETVRSVAGRMAENRLTALPVLADGKVVGMLSFVDVLQALADGTL